jgi:hypothetical protein
LLVEKKLNTNQLKSNILFPEIQAILNEIIVKKDIIISGKKYENPMCFYGKDYLYLN